MKVGMGSALYPGEAEADAENKHLDRMHALRRPRADTNAASSAAATAAAAASGRDGSISARGAHDSVRPPQDGSQSARGASARSSHDGSTPRGGAFSGSSSIDGASPRKGSPRGGSQSPRQLLGGVKLSAYPPAVRKAMLDAAEQLQGTGVQGGPPPRGNHAAPDLEVTHEVEEEEALIRSLGGSSQPFIVEEIIDDLPRTTTSARAAAPANVERTPTSAAGGSGLLPLLPTAAQLKLTVPSPQPPSPVHAGSPRIESPADVPANGSSSSGITMSMGSPAGGAETLSESPMPPAPRPRVPRVADLMPFASMLPGEENDEMLAVAASPRDLGREIGRRSEDESPQHYLSLRTAHGVMRRAHSSANRREVSATLGQRVWRLTDTYQREVAAGVPRLASSNGGWVAVVLDTGDYGLVPLTHVRWFGHSPMAPTPAAAATSAAAAASARLDARAAEAAALHAIEQEEASAAAAAAARSTASPSPPPGISVSPSSHGAPTTSFSRPPPLDERLVSPKLTLAPDGSLRGGSPSDLQRAMQLLASLGVNIQVDVSDPNPAAAGRGTVETASPPHTPPPRGAASSSPLGSPVGSSMSPVGSSNGAISPDSEDVRARWPLTAEHRLLYGAAFESGVGIEGGRMARARAMRHLGKSSLPRYLLEHALELVGCPAEAIDVAEMQFVIAMLLVSRGPPLPPTLPLHLRAELEERRDEPPPHVVERQSAPPPPVQLPPSPSALGAAGAAGAAAAAAAAATVAAGAVASRATMPPPTHFAVRIGIGAGGRARCSIVSRFPARLSMPISPTSPGGADAASRSALGASTRERVRSQLQGERSDVRMLAREVARAVEASTQCDLPFVSHSPRPASWPAAAGNAAAAAARSSALLMASGAGVRDAAVQVAIPFATADARGGRAADIQPAPFNPLNYRARILLDDASGDVRLRVFNGERPWDAPRTPPRKTPPPRAPPPKAQSPEAAPQLRAPPSLQAEARR